jgi:hypothetical protein
VCSVYVYASQISRPNFPSLSKKHAKLQQRCVLFDVSTVLYNAACLLGLHCWLCLRVLNCCVRMNQNAVCSHPQNSHFCCVCSCITCLHELLYTVLYRAVLELCVLRAVYKHYCYCTPVTAATTAAAALLVLLVCDVCSTV